MKPSPTERGEEADSMHDHVSGIEVPAPKSGGLDVQIGADGEQSLHGT